MRPEDTRFMALALEEARKCLEEGEVPVGAVLVRDGEVIAKGRNSRETAHTALGHAEINAIQAACAALETWRLSGTTLYVTLEPCPMCAGAIINARIGRVVYGASDEKAGAVGSIANLFAMPFNHRPTLTTGVLAGECDDLLKDFFLKLRQKKQ